MSVERVDCWDIVCDGCEARLLEEAGYSCVADPETWLDESAWLTTEDDRHLCPDCQPIEEED